MRNFSNLNIHNSVRIFSVDETGANLPQDEDINELLAVMAKLFVTKVVAVKQTYVLAHALARNVIDEEAYYNGCFIAPSEAEVIYNFAKFFALIEAVCEKPDEFRSKEERREYRFKLAFNYANLNDGVSLSIVFFYDY